MHIVFVVGSYHPNYSAVGKCVANVAEELAVNNNVTVISLKNHYNQRFSDEINNTKIVRVTTKELEKNFQLSYKTDITNGIVQLGYQIKIKINKISRNLKTIFSRRTINQNVVESYLEGLKNISHPIDTIIPVCMPYEAVVASIEYKKTTSGDVKVIPYLFDQFVENNSLHRLKIITKIKRNAHLSLEENTVKYADSMLILKQLNDHYLKHYKEFMDKVHVVEHPLLKKPLEQTTDDNDITTFIYAGSFYKKIRNPKYMLSLFKKTFTNYEGVLNLYSFGDCNQIIEKYTQNESRIKSLGKVDSDKISKELYKSDFLVALGNKDNTQVPSKIFEYFAYGKPIIYLYTNLKDTNLEVLEKYPLALCLEQTLENEASNLTSIINFCSDNFGRRLDYSELKKTFEDATPEYTVKIINSLIK